MTITDLVREKLSESGSVMQSPATTTDANGVTTEGVVKEVTDKTAADTGLGEKIAADTMSQVCVLGEKVAAALGGHADLMRAAIDAVLLMKTAGIFSNVETVVPPLKLDSPSDYINLAAQIADRARKTMS